MNKQQILNITGLTEKEFYNKYPDQESFCNDYPQACQQLAQAEEGIEVTGSLTSPEEIQKLGKAYGFRTDSNKNFQQDMYNYVGKNKPELFKESINKFGPANAGLTNYGSVQGYRPDAYIGPRVADMMGRLGTPQAPKQPSPSTTVYYDEASAKYWNQHNLKRNPDWNYHPIDEASKQQKNAFDRAEVIKYGSKADLANFDKEMMKRDSSYSSTFNKYYQNPQTQQFQAYKSQVRPMQPAMPATFPGQQPVASFSQNPGGGWNIGPAQAPGQPGGMPARQQGAAPAQGGQPQMSHQGPWHTNQQGEYTRYYTNTPGDMNPGVSPSAAPATQAYGGNIYAKGGGVKTTSKKPSVNPYVEVDSKNADAFRQFLPLPMNVSQMLAKVALKDARMSNESLSDDQKLILWNTIQNAMKRSGVTNGGGTEYQDYGEQGYGTPEDFNNWFNRGQVGFLNGAYKSVTNPGFNLASTIGRGRYWQNPQNSDEIYYTDVYDWNPTEKNFKGSNAYQILRNNLRSNEDTQLNKEKNDNYRMNFKLSKKEIDEIKNKQDTWNQGMLGLGSFDNGGEMIKRADGSYSKRGLWDNIRANAGSGKEPTKEMLEQERKIKMAEGGEQDDTQASIMAALKQGMKPQEILKKLVAMGLTKEQAAAYIQSAIQHPGSQYDNTYVNDSNYDYMDDGGEMAQGGSMFAYGGIHLDPAKKGTFKAQATRMDMSVQEAASHILANKEDYSPAMVKKANFARNFAKEEGGPVLETFLGGGPYKNVVPFVSEEDYFPEGYATGPIVSEAVESTTEQSKPIDYKGVSIVDLLNSVGKPSGYASRKKLAKNLGISNYRGTAAQNAQLIKMILQDSDVVNDYENIESTVQNSGSSAAISKPSLYHRTPSTPSSSLPAQQPAVKSQQPAVKLQDIYLAIHPERAQELNNIRRREEVMYAATSDASRNLKSQRANSFDDSYVLNQIANDPHSPANVGSKKRKQFARDLAIGTLAPWLAESALMAATSKYLPYGLTEIPQVASSLRAGQRFLPQASKLLPKATPKNFVTASGLSFEMGGQPEYKHGGYIGMDGKFHMAKGSGTFSGNAYYSEGGEEDPNLTAPYDGSNPNAPLPPFDPTAYQAMQLPTGYTGYSKKDPATGQFVPIDNIRKDDLWKHLSGSQKWNTGQTATQKVGRAIGDVGNAVNYGVAAAGAYSNYLQNNEKEAEYNNYMQNMGTTASLYGPSAAGTSRGDYSVTGSSYGQFRPNQMGNMSAKGMTQGMQFGAYGGQTMYTIGGGVFDALLTDADASSPVVYNPLSSMPAFRQPNAVDNTYVNQGNYRLSGLPNSPNNVSVSESGTDIATKLNNPTNMIYSSWMSKLGAQPSSIKQTDGNGYFAKFPDINTALKAYETQMFGEVDGVFKSNYYKADTNVDKALRTWSGNGYGGNIYPQIANKTLGELTASERRELIKRQIKNESSAMYSQLKKKGILQMGGTYQEGGIVEMTDTEIKQFLANGGQLEFLD